jgi:hypothetical protein
MKFIAFFILFLSLNANAMKLKYKLTYSKQQDFQLLEFSGEIPVLKNSKQLKSVLDQIDGSADILLKVGLSMGGHTAGFRAMMKKIRNKCDKSRGSKCKIVAVFTSHCGSSCTYLPLLADYAVSLPHVMYGFHKRWAIIPSFTIQSTEAYLNEYIELGANRDWFLSHEEELISKQVEAYWINTQVAMDAGIIDEQIFSYKSFVRNYNWY